MTPEEFYKEYEEVATRVGTRFAWRARLIGWDKDDSVQQAKLTLWRLAGRLNVRGLTEPIHYLQLCIRRKLQRSLKPGHVLLAASDRKLAGLSTIDPPSLLDAPTAVNDVLHGRHVSRKQRKEIVQWLR